MDGYPKSKITLESALYALAFLLAIGLRFIALGQAPLGDSEARLALQAMHLARGGSPLLDGQAAFLSLTTAMFFLFGADNWLARFAPALFGALLSLAPLLFRQRLGKGAALILAFLVAVDPGLVAVSRLADARMLALVFGVLSLGFFLQRKVVPAGIFLGAAFLGGSSVWLGVMSLGLGWFAFYALQPAENGTFNGSQVGIYDQSESQLKPRLDRLKFAFWALGTIAAVGTLFMLQPKIISSAAGGLADFVSGLLGSVEGQPLPLIVWVWFLSSPLCIVLAVVEAARAKKQGDQNGLFLAWWWLAAILMVLVYPAQRTVDLVWQAVPMLALASKSLARILALRKQKPVFYVQAAMTVVLLGSMWLSGVGAVSAFNENEQSLRLAALLASLFLLMAASLLILWGWGSRVTLGGLRLGVVVILSIYTLGTAWDAAGLSNLPENELWRLDAYPKDADLISHSLKDFSMWKTGRPEAVEVTLAELDQPSLKWALRDFRSVSLMSGLSGNASAGLMITPKVNELKGSAVYSGQLLAWNVAPDWDKMGSKEWLKWLMFREAPMKKQEIQFWVRTDLFPGATAPKPQNP